MPRANRTALGRSIISDNLLDMFTLGFLPADAHKAAQTLGFEFDPVTDPEFYRTWGGPPRLHEEMMGSAQKVLDRFDLWFPTQPPVIKTYMGIIGLLDSADQFDNFITDALSDLRRKHRLQMMDSDGSMFEVCDYIAVHEDENIDAALSGPRFNWWCRLLEQQARRIADMPTMDFGDFKVWHAELIRERLIAQQTNRRRHDEETNDWDYRRDRPNKKHQRRVFNRSLKLFEKFFGQTAAKNFLGGKNLWLRGHHFVWKLKAKPGEIYRNSIDAPYAHTPFKITFCDHELNALANGCVLFEAMPILDQAVAFHLHIQDADDELEFFNKANLSNITDIGRIHPILLAAPSFANAVAWTDRDRRWNNEDRPQAEDDREIPQYEFERFALQQDPSIDDDPLPPGHPDVEDADIVDYEPYTYQFIPRYYYHTDDTDIEDPLPVDLDDPRGIGYSCETIEPSHYRWVERYENEEERQQIVDLYSRYRRRESLQRVMRSRDSVVQLLRRKLISKLDIDPILLQYLRFPEARAYYLPHTTMDMPLLRGWLEHKTPLCG